MIQGVNLFLLPSMDLHRSALKERESTDMDANGDGVVTPDEVQTDLKFSSASDTNQDGIITLEEAISHLEDKKAKDLNRTVDANEVIAQLPKDVIDQLASVQDSEESKLRRAIQKNFQLDTAYLKDLVQVLEEDYTLQLLA